MTLDKCIVLRIGTLTGCPLCRESHPLCRLKNPTVISIWLLVGFHPATRSVQSTPADNTRKRVWQYIEKEKKERKNDMPDTIRSMCKLFADDSKLYLTIKSRNDQEIIQSDLFKLCDWSKKWRLLGMALSLHSSPFYFLRAGHQPQPRGSRYRSQRPTQALPNYRCHQ